MCSCGCNTCETKIRGPLLTEGRVKKLISENLSYHIDNNISLMENVFRIGSDAHLSMIKEAKKLYSRGVLDLCEEDEALMETHLGEFDLYENEIIPLDLPMLSEQMDLEDELANEEFGMDYDQLGSNEKEWVRDEMDNMSIRESNSKYPDFDLDKNIRYQEGSISSGMWRYTGTEQGGKGVYRNLNNDQILAFDRSDFDIFRNNLSSHFDFSESLSEVEIGDIVKIDATYGGGKGEVENKVGSFVVINGESYHESDVEVINEAKKKKKKEKKDPPIGKPKRGGSKAYYVYVRDPKTKKVKKVSFGSGGLRAKIRNPKARKAFAARHNCKNKKDRTKAGYWSCNLPRYASQLGLGANMNTFW
jgi:hypothetical protein